MKILKILLFIMLLCFSELAFGATIHVPANYSTIQAAINASANSDVILVAAGTYTGFGNRNVDFNGKSITVQSEDGPEVTIIDCQKQTRGINFDSNETATSVLSGFKIVNGLANKDNGGGVYCKNASPTIKNCIIENCDAVAGLFYGLGGGLYIEASSPLIENCIIRSNTAKTGGGLFMESSSAPNIRNCFIINNTASGNGGGVVCNLASMPVVANCTIAGNVSGSDGGGIKLTNPNTNLVLTNSIVWGNTPDQIYEALGATATASYCNIEGVYPGTENITADPLFINSENGDYHIQFLSPCRDAGTSSNAPDTDIDGDARPIGNGYDIGADECTQLFQVGVPAGQDDVNNVLYTAYAGIAHLKDAHLHRIMVYDLLDLVKEQTTSTMMFTENALVKAFNMRMGFTTLFEYSTYGGTFKIALNPISTEDGLTKFTAIVSFDFNDDGFVLYPNGYCKFKGVDGVVDFTAYITGYYEIKLLQPGYIQQFFLTTIDTEANNTLTAEYIKTYQPLTVSYDQWKISMVANYGQYDPENPGDNPVNVKLIPEFLPFPAEYETDNRDYSVGGSFTITPSDSAPAMYTFVSGFHYNQTEDETGMKITMEGNLVIPGMEGAVKVETPQIISVNEEGILTSGVLNIIGNNTNDAITFSSSGSTDFQSDHIEPSAWSVGNWQDVLDPLPAN